MNDRVLIITEGKSEFETLSILLNKAEPEKKFDVRKIIIDPKTKDDSRIIATLKSFLKSFQSKNINDRYSKILLVIDSEDIENRGACLIELRNKFQKGMQEVFGQCPCAVVFKVSKYENWIIASVNSLSKIKGYNISQRQINEVCRGADKVRDAVKFLEDAKGKEFDKVEDSQRIVPKLDIVEIERNSRSFRKFLKEIGVKKYEGLPSKRYIS